MSGLPIVYNDAYSIELPSGHRFPMPKFVRLFAHLRDIGLIGDNLHQAVPAPRSWLEFVHTPAYVTSILERTLDRAAERRLGLPVSEALATRSQAATGGTVLAARLALEYGLACNTAGGSHHAFADAGSGFCVFNDVAVAAAVLLREGTVRRVLVIDLDVHQGDGTALIFHDEPRVTTFSVHCRTNFPARKQQSDLDLAVERGMADEAYLALLQEHLPALLARVQPDLVFYNAGVDPHEDDRLGHLALSDRGLAARDRYVIQTCRHQRLPVVGVIGGGYGHDVDVIARRHSTLHREAAALFDAAATS